MQVEILEESLQKERDASRHTIEQHIRALKSKEQEVEGLKQKMSKLPSLHDLQALQRQIKMMQVRVCPCSSVQHQGVCLDSRAPCLCPHLTAYRDGCRRWNTIPWTRWN